MNILFIYLTITLTSIALAATTSIKKCSCKSHHLNHKRHLRRKSPHLYKKLHSVTGGVTKREHVDQNDFVNFLSLIKSLSFDELAQLSMHRPETAEAQMSRYDSAKVAKLLRMLPQSEITGEGTLHGRELQDDSSKMKNHFYLSVAKFNNLLDTLLSNNGNKAVITGGENTANDVQNSTVPGAKLFFDTIERAINDSAARIKEQYVKVKSMSSDTEKENSPEASSPSVVENQDESANKVKKERKPLDFNKYDFGAIENVIKKLTSNESLRHLENTGTVPIDNNFKLSSTEFLMILKLLVSEGLGPHNPTNKDDSAGSESAKQPIERTSDSTASSVDSKTDDLFAENIKTIESSQGAEAAPTNTDADSTKSSESIKEDHTKDVKKVFETLKDEHSAVTNKPVIEPITNEYLVEKLNNLKLHSTSLLPSKERDLSTSSDNSNAEDPYAKQYNQALIDKSSNNIKSLTKQYDEKYQALTQKLKENEEKYNTLKTAINSKEREMKNDENAALSSFLSDEKAEAEKSSKSSNKISDSKQGLFSGTKEDKESSGDKGDETNTDGDKKPVGVKFEQFLKLLKNKDLSGNKEWKKNTYLHLSVSKFEDLFEYIMKKNNKTTSDMGTKDSGQKDEMSNQQSKKKKNKMKDYQESEIKDETDQFQNLAHLKYFDNEDQKGSKSKKGQNKKVEKFAEDISTKDVKYQPQTVGKFKKLLKLITFRNLIRDLPRGKDKYADYVKLNKDFIKRIDELLKLLAFNKIFDEKKVI